MSKDNILSKDYKSPGSGESLNFSWELLSAFEKEEIRQENRHPWVVGHTGSLADRVNRRAKQIVALGNTSYPKALDTAKKDVFNQVEREGY